MRPDDQSQTETAEKTAVIAEAKIETKPQDTLSEEKTEVAVKSETKVESQSDNASENQSSNDNQTESASLTSREASQEEARSDRRDTDRKDGGRGRGRERGRGRGRGRDRDRDSGGKRDSRDQQARQGQSQRDRDHRVSKNKDDHMKSKQMTVPSDLSPVVKPYGDVMDDGAIQMSFTLPYTASPETKVAAKLLVEKMGFRDVSVLHMEAMGDRFTFFVVYASTDHHIDISKIEVPKAEHPLYDFDEINNLIKDKVGRKVTILGACIGTDAHTVGIDAIFNMKGYMGHYGLERYSYFDAINLRAQVDVEFLAQKVVDHQADAVLVSRVVTQRDSHIEEFKKFLEALSKLKNVPTHLIKICGGPRVDHALAKEIGYDAGFGGGTLPSQVASFICDEMIKRYEDR